MTAVEARRPGAWPKGVSGNPRGKRPGTRHRRPLAELLAELREREGGAILGTLLSAAKGGDAVAAGELLRAMTAAGEGLP